MLQDPHPSMCPFIAESKILESNFIAESKILESNFIAERKILKGICMAERKILVLPYGAIERINRDNTDIISAVAVRSMQHSFSRCLSAKMTRLTLCFQSMKNLTKLPVYLSSAELVYQF